MHFTWHREGISLALSTSLRPTHWPTFSIFNVLDVQRANKQTHKPSKTAHADKQQRFIVKGATGSGAAHASPRLRLLQQDQSEPHAPQAARSPALRCLPAVLVPSSLRTHGSPGSLVTLPPAGSAAAAAASGRYRPARPARPAHPGGPRRYCAAF